MDKGGTGVCLLYMGGPESLDQVEPFLAALFADRDLIRLPGGRLMQGILARVIVRRRAPVVRARYAHIGGGSPLTRITMRQAELLQRSLANHGPFQVAVGMRYAAPRADLALETLGQAGIDHLVALPLYPHYSAATTGSSFKDLQRALDRSETMDRIQVTWINDFHRHPLYIAALADTVRRGMAQLGGDAGNTVVVFSAHSLPRRLVELGDPYQHQVETTVRQVADKLGLSSWQLGYQSRSGPVRWLEPDVLDLVARLGEQRNERLLVVPVSFVSDHIETLHEIDIEMRQHAMDSGVRQFARAPALNEDAAFIAALTEITLEACQQSPKDR